MWSEGVMLKLPVKETKVPNIGKAVSMRPEKKTNYKTNIVHNYLQTTNRCSPVRHGMRHNVVNIAAVEHENAEVTQLMGL